MPVAYVATGGGWTEGITQRNKKYLEELRLKPIESLLKNAVRLTTDSHSVSMCRDHRTFTEGE